MLTEVFNDYKVSIEVQKRVKQRVSGVYEEHWRPAWGVLIFLLPRCDDAPSPPVPISQVIIRYSCLELRRY